MGPLTGVRVVEVSQVIAGPVAGMYLGDLGAEVIKVERPEGDLWRWVPSVSPDSPLQAAGMGRSFLAINRNKRSISLDLQSLRGREVFLRLVKRSDILIENLRPGTMQRLGLGYDALEAINPRLIYASISAYGHQGPDAMKTGNDNCALGRAGVLSARRYPDGTPVIPSVFIADMSCGILVAFAVTACLVEREQTGRGQKIETSLLASAIAMSAPQLLRTGDDVSALKPRSDPMSMVYKCRDGLYMVVTFMTDSHWQALCRVPSLEHLASDPDFSTPAGRAKHNEVLCVVLESVFLTRPRAEWLLALDEAGVPCSPVLGREEVFHEPQVRANELLVECYHHVVGKVSVAGLPIKFSRTPGSLHLGAPTLGEHTTKILRELNYSEAEIEQFLAEGATGAARGPSAPAGD